MDWSAILGAGGLNDQQGQIDQQLADVLARRRGMQQGQYSTGLGALLGGIGNLMQRNKYDTQEAGLRGQRQDISGKLSGARGVLADAFTSASQPVQAPPDMIAAPGFDQASQEREQQQKMQQLQMAAMLSGDPQMAGYAQHAPQMALQQQQFQQGAERFPLQQAIERQKLEQGAPQAALGGQTPSVYELLTKRKMAASVGINPVTGQPYDKHGTPTTPTPPADSTAPPAYDKRLDPMLKSLRDDLDSSISRGGVMKGNQERLNAAQRLLTLAVDPLTGGPANLTPQQMSEVSNSLATLIGGGGSSEGSRKELTPYTKGRTMAEVMQWLSDKPQGADQQAFVKQMIDTAKREQDTAQNSIRTAQAQRLPLHSQLFNLFPDQAQNALSGYGFEPGMVDLKTGKYTPKASASAPAAGGSGGGAVRKFTRVNGKLVEVQQ